MNDSDLTPLESMEARFRLIADLAEDERPREKALTRGFDALSDAELLALLFGTGVRGMSVIDLSQRILDDNGGRLSRLARLSPQELQSRYKGIGQAKAITLCAAIQLGVRAERDAQRNQLVQIRDSEGIYNIMRGRLQWLDHEEFWCLYLSRSNRLLCQYCVSRGGLDSTIVDRRLIMKRALQESASSIVLVHNHPSGTLAPSSQDDSLTKDVVQGAKTLGLRVLDHLIIADTGFFSYTDQGRMPY